MTDLKCPYCIETRPSRSRLQTHVDNVHRNADIASSRREAVLNARTIVNVVPDLDVPAQSADTSARLDRAGAEIRDLKAQLDNIDNRMKALDAGDQRRTRSLAAEGRFRTLVAEQGGIVLDVGWKGNKEPHSVVCAAGHVGTIRPTSVLQGCGICNRCGQLKRHASRAAKASAKFRGIVAEAGGEVLTADWRGTLVPHPVRCAAGHEEMIKPKRVLQGRGICQSCTWTDWDTVYVVFNEELGQVKPGVTSGDPKVRLGAHATDGFRKVLAVWSGLPEGLAAHVEQNLLQAMKLRDARPVRGREYFSGGWANVIVDDLTTMIGQPEGDWS